MKKLLFIPFAVLLLAAGCSKDEGGEDPNPGPGPEPAPPVSVWDGTSVTEPADMDPTAKTATIMLASDLAWLSQESNASPENTFEGWTFTLGINIDLADKKWTPIAQWIGTNQVIFKGSFDGNGHSIKGLYVDTPDLANCGFLGVTQGAVIKDLHVAGTVRGQNQVGGICANAQQATHIVNCTFTGDIEGAQSTGGICGRTQQETQIKDCTFTGDIEGAQSTGGICGYTQQETQIENCTFKGNIISTNNIGGICGMSYSTQIKNCKVTGNIEGSFSSISIGGICGNAQLTTRIENCTSSGKVEITESSKIYMGGICGWIESSSSILNCHSTATIVYGGGEVEMFVGGVVGTGQRVMENGDNEIRNCSFSGKFEKGSDIAGEEAYFGGIIGKLNASTISGCKNMADITIEGNSQIFLGGITGLIGTSPSSIIGCYNTGAITNKSTDDGLTGGIAGAIDAGNAIRACYNTGKVTPASMETSMTMEDANYEINQWQQANVTMVECFYKANAPEVEGAKRFTANQWPQAKANSGWNIGNDPEAGKFWKDLGTPGTEDYPALWWE